MLPLDPQRVTELQRRLAARQLREEDFQILPDVLAWFRQRGQLPSEEDLTEERLQASLLGRASEVEEGAPAESANRRARRPGRSARSAAGKRSRKRRR
jgi:hypothetical protein